MTPRKKLYSSNAEKQRAYRERLKQRKALEKKNELLSNEFQIGLSEYLERLANRKDIDVGYSRSLGWLPNKGVINEVEIEFRQVGKPSIICKWDMNQTSLDQLKQEVDEIIKKIKEGKEYGFQRETQLPK